MSAAEALYYPPLELPPEGTEPIWWPVNSAQQAAIKCRAQLLLYGGASGGGKLMGMDEQIPTPKGFVRNGDLKTGNDIYGEDGCVYQVLIAHPPQIEESFRVSFDDGTSAYVHAGHLWHTFTFSERQAVRRRSPERRAARRASRPSRSTGSRPDMAARNSAKALDYISAPVTGAVRTTEEIMRTMSVDNCKRANHSIRLAMPVSAQVQYLPISPYVLGAWLGDGTTAGGDITIGKHVGNEMRKLLRQSGEQFRVSAADPISNRCYRLKARLRKLGVLNNKHIPHAYLWASAEQRLDLLRGLMDTDGCCNKDGQVEFWNYKKIKNRFRNGWQKRRQSLSVRFSELLRKTTQGGLSCSDALISIGKDKESTTR